MTSSPAVTSASQWADALDLHMKTSKEDAGTLISFGYATGAILGVALDPDHPEADDERGVIASEDGWVIRYVEQSGWWEVVSG
ncbi:hypothetical protein H3146_24425 [Streptomyces sp. OF3]|uniref:Uncharacterized protein n=1 Tax=Streptomyces alkaliterrae TaxID=2213162 RepID=A0A7W3WQ56_9ACTN|nr:hypothetical protein [Streptomyces alkaliterrae]MBB1256474.1 hypothetical protein [Streptomyces alkaliterrae]